MAGSQDRLVALPVMDDLNLTVSVAKYSVSPYSLPPHGAERGKGTTRTPDVRGRHRLLIGCCLFAALFLGMAWVSTSSSAAGEQSNLARAVVIQRLVDDSVPLGSVDGFGDDNGQAFGMFENYMSSAPKAPNGKTAVYFQLRDLIGQP